MRILFFLCLSFVAIFAGQSFLNELDEETGDFGGYAFPYRHLYYSFIETSNETLSSYGFYMPTLEPSSFSETGYPYAAVLGLNRSSLSHPSSLPFFYIGLSYYPFGSETFNPSPPPPPPPPENESNDTEPTTEPTDPSSSSPSSYFIIYLWFKATPFSRGIECNGTEYPPCETTDYLYSQFSRSPESWFYPDGYVNDPEEWGPTWGAPLKREESSGGGENNETCCEPTEAPGGGDNETVNTGDVRFFFGGYDGELIYYAVKIPAEVYVAAETHHESIEIEWPKVHRFPVHGYFFKKITIEFDSLNGSYYKTSFTDLYAAPVVIEEKYPVCEGEPLTSYPASNYTEGSTVKNCFLLPYSPHATEEEQHVEAGYLVRGLREVDLYEKYYCCIWLGGYNHEGGCAVDYCTHTSTLTEEFFYQEDKYECYAECVEVLGWEAPM